MSQMILFTVQGDKNGKDCVADESGLTEYLGYRPVFCSRLDPNSLAESWFKIWSASPRYPRTINIFIMDSADCIPMNVLDWTNKCLRRTPDKTTIADVLYADTESDLMTDYLVKEIPESRIEISVPALLYSTEIFEYAFGNENGIIETFEKTQHSCDIRIKEIQSKTPKNGPKLDDIEYAVLRMSGIIPVLWQIATGHNMKRFAYMLKPCDFSGVTFHAAEELLIKWDKAIASKKEFTKEEFEEMHQLFLQGLDVAVKNMLTRESKASGVNRNDLCPCGSGLKYKQCCSKSGINDLVEKVERDLPLSYE